MYNKLFFLFAIIILLSGFTPAQEYTVELIVEGGGLQYPNPTSINNNGVVIGLAYNSQSFKRGFIYQNGIMTEIYFSGSTSYSLDFAINDSDNFIGTGFFSNPSFRGFFNYDFLSDLGQGDTWANDINNSNLVLGSAWDSQNTAYLVIYQDTSIIHTYEFDGSPEAINDFGIVAGTDWPVDYGIPFIYDYHTGQFNYLDVIGTGDMEAWDINNSNQVVGYFETATSWVGFLWNGTSYIELANKSLAYAINDSGVVVGTFQPSTYPPSHAFIYDNVNGFRDLNDLIPPNSGWVLTDAADINENGQIIGRGYFNSVSKSFILHPNILQVTHPQNGDRFISGETDTIRWMGGGGIDSIRIVAELDWQTNNPIEYVVTESNPFNSGEYAWQIPDTLLSYKTKIRIEDKSDPSEFAESGSFKLKGYVLTRVKSDSTYEKFGRTIHAWQFGNTTVNMWPQTWWSQFSYNNVIDPYTNDYYDEDFHRIWANRFPDWLAFARAFGVNQCYWNVPILGLYYRDAAVDYWKKQLQGWRGSCFGFAVSSLLAFYNTNLFITAYPEMPAFNNLYQFTSPLTGIQGDSIRYIINSLFTHQYGKQHLQYKQGILNDTPTQTLNKIKNILVQDNPDGGLLRLDNPGGPGAHAIVFYKLVQNSVTPNIYTISVYDNSYPAILNATVTIDTSANGGNGSWIDSLWWAGNLGLQSRGPISAYFNIPILPKGPLDTDNPTGNQNIETYVSRNSNVVIIDSLGNSIGWVDSLMFNNIPNAIPIIPEEPSYAPPEGYDLPVGTYSINLSNISDSTAFLYLYNEDGIYSYWRDDAIENQEDRINIGDGFSVANPDPVIKNIELKTTMPQLEDEKVFQFKDVSVAGGDSIFVKQENMDHYTFKNFGSQKSYDLKIKYNSNSFAHLFKHSAVSLNQNTTHILYPDWDSLSTASVKILIDVGNDGTIDDSIFVENEVTGVKDQGFFGLPDNYYLAQNYPNPFNPVTTIRYSIPQRSDVTIKIFDVLGNEVTTLVNEEKERGVYTVNFDASDLASGMYLYRLQARSFVETRKMILLK
jgi:probable HAF family extracellular repeat protein